jgi:hypothetical protein
MLSNILKGSLAGPPPPLPLNIQYTGSAIINNSSSSKTVNINIGTADVNRWVILLVRFPPASTSGLLEVSSSNPGTINGVNTTRAWSLGTPGLVNSGELASPTYIQAGGVGGGGCIYAKVPNGTGSVSCTINLTRGTLTGLGRDTVILAYVVYGRTNIAFSGGPYTSQSVFNVPTPIVINTPALDVPANGFHIYFIYANDSASVAGTWTWSGSPSTPTNSSGIIGGSRQSAIASVRNNLAGGSVISGATATLTISTTSTNSMRVTAAAWTTS